MRKIRICVSENKQLGINGLEWAQMNSVRWFHMLPVDHLKIIQHVVYHHSVCVCTDCHLLDEHSHSVFLSRVVKTLNFILCFCFLVSPSFFFFWIPGTWDESILAQRQKPGHAVHVEVLSGSCGPWGSIKEPSVLFGVRLRTPLSDVSGLD